MAGGVVMAKKPPKITKEITDAFFATLEDNEGCMGEGAALAVTLTMFGYEDYDMDVLVDMAEALDHAP